MAKQDSKVIKITNRTNFATKFKVGQRVELEFVPLSEYTWDDDGDPQPALDPKDFQFVVAGDDRGVIQEIDDYNEVDDVWLRVRSDSNGITYSWSREHLRTIRILGMADPRDIPSTFELDRGEYTSSVTFTFAFGEIAWEDWEDSGAVSWEFIRWLAGEYGVGERVAFACDGHAVKIENIGKEKLLTIGCWDDLKESEVLKFLAWAMERAPEGKV